VVRPDIALPKDALRARTPGLAPLQQFAESSKAKAGVGGAAGKKKGKDADRGKLGPDIPEAKGKNAVRRGKGRDNVDVDLGSTRQSRPRLRNQGGLESEEDERRAMRRAQKNRRRNQSSTVTAPRSNNAVLQLPCTIREFCEATGVAAAQVMKVLMGMGTTATINATMEDSTVELMAEHFGVNLELKQQESLEDQMMEQFATLKEGEEGLEPRPPVVTFLGHVDHGKTSLLDAIIGINVVSGEAGGITQHIRAYTIEKNNRRISFVDTPGHEAFTEMRARGANVTDIAVLVVAADDGIMPQTEEAISHAKAAGVPIIVALNKIDLPSANQEKCLQDLAAHELLPSQWGGEVEVVPTSAIKGTGLDQLLETILVTAELHEYKANPHCKASGTCLEAEQGSDMGVKAKIIVQNGTLNVGDIVVCGGAFGRVKAMYDTLDSRKRVNHAGPSVPVNLTGLDLAPEAGDRFYVLDDITKAREIASGRTLRRREKTLSGVTTRVSLEDFQKRLEEGSIHKKTDNIVTLNLIIRADVRGSIEALLKELEKLRHPEVKIRVLQASVGGVSVGDVTLAHASDAVIISFNVVPDEAARVLADERQVEIRRYDIIYKVTDDIKATLEGRLKPEEQFVEMGTAMVLKVFSISRVGTIAGCRIMRGTIERDCRIRVIRDNRIIGDYAIDSLKREKDDAKEVRQGMECGIKLVGFNDIKETDTLEGYKIKEVARTLS
jgi:translation initiation factor IF-2